MSIANEYHVAYLHVEIAPIVAFFSFAWEKRNMESLTIYPSVIAAIGFYASLHHLFMEIVILFVEVCDDVGHTTNEFRAIYFDPHSSDVKFCHNSFTFIFLSLFVIRGSRRCSRRSWGLLGGRCRPVRDGRGAASSGSRRGRCAGVWPGAGGRAGGRPTGRRGFR